MLKEMKKSLSKALYAGSLTIALALVLFSHIVPLATDFVKFQQLGSFPKQKGCLLVANHPYIAWDIIMFHIWVRQQQLETPVHFLIAVPICYCHDLLTFRSFGTEIKTLPAVKKGNTTQKIVDILNSGEHVMAFLTPENYGTGLAHALRETGAPCYAIKMDKDNLKSIHIEQIGYDLKSSAQDITQHFQDTVNPRT